MDYAMLPRKRTRAHVEIPCLAVEDFDDGVWVEYPDRQGWDERSVQEWMILFRNPSPEFLAFLETWLFFGAIAAAFRKHVSLNDFTRLTEDGTRVIDTSILREWFSYYPPQPTIYSGEHFAVLGSIHTELQSRHYPKFHRDKRFSLISFIAAASPCDPRDPRLTIATSLFLETMIECVVVSGMARLASSQRNFDPRPWAVFGARNLINPKSSYIWRNMRNDGWCPSNLSVFSERLNTASIYFMQAMERPHPDWQHQMIRINPHGRAMSSSSSSESLQLIADPTHGSASRTIINSSNDDRALAAEPVSTKTLCSATKCAHLQLSDETYQTKHTDGCDKSTCYEMSADPGEVFEILKSGSIPLIMAVDNESTDRTLMLVPSQPDFSCAYVAISHVWSDGLGNVETSALPRCQVIRLSNMIQNLPGRHADIVLFWIDTIGCPPDVAGQDEAQNLAISMMRETYQNATAVLVLDSWLQAQSVTSVPDHESLMMIISSDWNRRLWTLQEGVLAKTLFFQFIDGVYDIDEGITRLSMTADPVVRWTILPALSERIHEIRSFSRIRNAPLWEKLDALRGSLSTRSTSVETDEALCLSTLMGMDKASSLQVIKAPPHDRMKVFWSLIKEPPRSIIFNDLPRLSAPCFRWAPRSFLGCRYMPTANRFERPTVQNTPGGVQFQASGLMWTTGSHPITNVLHLIGHDEVVYQMRFSLDGLPTTTHDVTTVFVDDHVRDPQASADDVSSQEAVDLFKLYGVSTLCFIFDNVEPPSTIPNNSHRQDLRGGILAIFQILANGVVHVSRVCSGSCVVLGPGADIRRAGNIPSFPVQRPSLGDDVDVRSFAVPTGVGYDRISGILRSAGAKVLGPDQSWLVD
ncbi:hypothetical protein QBC47DRAFT_385136 [Echria macrotheca]|uniref:Heterokaryon incompatibility domain-containing protein n=1 Tax=Echria macrotheca TaxID=438768 RepID=A0AAJ0F4X3_9PEZI|nr:hypothetical protein QBC47DRAFT_385136 [Echria macrotheca]